MGYGGQKPLYLHDYNCIVYNPYPDYFEAYRNIGRKFTRVASGDLPVPVLQAGVNVGGNVLFRFDSTILLSERLTLVDDLYLRGLGYPTHLKIPDNQPVTEDKYGQLFYGVNNKNVEITQLRLDGNYQNNLNLKGQRRGRDINLRGCENVHVHHNWVENARVFGFSAEAGIDKDSKNVWAYQNVFLDNCYNHAQFSSPNPDYDMLLSGALYNYSKGGGDIAFNSYAGAGNKQPHLIFFVGNIIDEMDGTMGSVAGGSWIGIKLEWSSRCFAINNEMYGVRIGVSDDSMGGGHHLMAGNFVELKYHPTIELSMGVICNNERDKAFLNEVLGHTSGGGQIGVYLDVDSVRCEALLNTVMKNVGTITGLRDRGTGNWYDWNDLYGCDTPISITGSGYRIGKYNRGFKVDNLLENVTVGVTSTTIPHGLAVTPNMIRVLPHADARVWESAVPTATNIYLQASASVECDIYVSSE